MLLWMLWLVLSMADAVQNSEMNPDVIVPHPVISN